MDNDRGGDAVVTVTRVWFWVMVAFGVLDTRATYDAYTDALAGGSPWWVTLYAVFAAAAFGTAVFLYEVLAALSVSPFKRAEYEGS